MTPSYTEQYITNLYIDKSLLILVSVIIWFCAGLSICTKIKERSLSPDILWIISIIVPSILQMPGAPEIRFFISLYLLAYYYVFVETDYKNLLLKVKKSLLVIILSMFIIIVLWISVFSDIQSRCHHITFRINNSNSGSLLPSQ